MSLEGAGTKVPRCQSAYRDNGSQAIGGGGRGSSCPSGMVTEKGSVWLPAPCRQPVPLLVPLCLSAHVLERSQPPTLNGRMLTAETVCLAVSARMTAAGGRQRAATLSQRRPGQRQITKPRGKSPSPASSDRLQRSPLGGTRSEEPLSEPTSRSGSQSKQRHGRRRWGRDRRPQC